MNNEFEEGMRVFKNAIKLEKYKIAQKKARLFALLASITALSYILGRIFYEKIL